MKIKEPKNSNYCASVVKIENLKPLENADRVQGAIIFGNQVIVSLETKVGDRGLYFPLETQLSKEFCKANNLFRTKAFNVDETKSGYFEDNRRVKCVKFRGNKSEGFFIPLASMDFALPVSSTIDYEKLYEDTFKLNMEFDEYNDIPICNKYIPLRARVPGEPGSKKQRPANRLEEHLHANQFKFHEDTSMLYKNVHNIKPTDLISITYKLHGSSGIVSNVLVNKTLKWYEKLLIKLGVDVPTEEYGWIYSSGKPRSKLPKGIIGSWKNPNEDYYTSDIWHDSYEMLRPFVQQGMSIYYEIVGYTSTGSMIQKGFDYGQEEGSFGVYIYRVTYTNPKGKVFEFSAKQVQDWCAFNRLNAVPQLFYGLAAELSDERMTDRNWQNKFLETIKERYNEKDCYMCHNRVPEEGCVIRIEKDGFEAFKQKSNAFYALETKNLDKGIVGEEE